MNQSSLSEFNLTTILGDQYHQIVNNNQHVLNSQASCQADDVTTILTKYAINSMLIVIIFASILGNLLVCIAIYTDRRLRKLSNLFLVSLALADLFVGSIVMTLELTNNLMGYWMFGEKLCETWISFDIMCCTASILNLCAVSLDRFVHIKDPLRYNQWMTKKVVLLAVGLIWLLSGLISFVPVSLGWHKPSSNGGGSSSSGSGDQHNSPPSDLNLTQLFSSTTTTTTTTIRPPPSLLSTLQPLTVPSSPDEYQCALDLTPIYAVISSTISFYLPCLIMIALYTRLYLYARKHVQHIRAMAKPLHFDYGETETGSSTRSSNHTKTNQHHHHNHHHVMDHKAAITLGVIMGVFLFCWVPFFCMNIIAAFCKTCIPEPVFKVLTWLGWFNSALNPIIYSIFNSEFREAFRKILITTLRDDWCRGWAHKDSWISAKSGNHASNRYSSGKSDRHDPHGKLTGANGPPPPPPTGTTGYAVKLLPGVVQSSSTKCGTLIKCKSTEATGNSKSYMDIIPIKDNIEIIQSTGKISAI